MNTMLQEVAEVVKHLLNPAVYKIHYAILPLLSYGYKSWVQGLCAGYAQTLSLGTHLLPSPTDPG